MHPSWHGLQKINSQELFPKKLVEGWKEPQRDTRFGKQGTGHRRTTGYSCAAQGTSPLLGTGGSRL
jgi:hypothetical protein